MSNLGSLEKKRRALVKKLEALRDSMRPKAIEFGKLTHTHRSDPAYSVARFDNLEKELEGLRKREAGLQYDLDQVNLEITLAKIKGA